MMDNMILKFSGHMSQLEAAIDFAVRMSCFETDSIGFQTTEDGRFCLGWGVPCDGWTSFPFDFNAKIVAMIIGQFLDKQPKPVTEFDNADGMKVDGFYMKTLEYADMEGINDPYRCIVTFERYTCYYSK